MAGASRVPKLASEYWGEVSMQVRMVRLPEYFWVSEAARPYALAESIDRSVVRTIE